MSSFKITAKHKTTGEIHEIWCMDDYFDKRIYGYIPNIIDGKPLREEEFYNQYEPIEDKTNEKR